MAERNRIVVVVAALLLVIAFWFLLLSPKRAEVAAADEQIEMLHASIADAEQRAAIGEEARSHFASDYAQVVTLGKAVPDGDEQGALMVQLNQLGLRNDAAFTSISMEGSGAPVAEATDGEGEAVIEPSATEPLSEEDAASPTDPEATATAVEGNATTSTEPTEENVASLPLGATVGSAELATIPYQLEFSGDFFKLADFIGGIDRLVAFRSDNELQVDGRLITIDGFSLSPGEGGDLRELTGSFAVTTFVTPAAEGRTAGATPQGPDASLLVPVALADGSAP